MQIYPTNFSSAKEKGILLRAMSDLRGMWVVTLKRGGRARSGAQNRLYWGIYVEAFRRHMRGQGVVMSAELVHELFKEKFLKTPVINPATGELLAEVTRSTTTLTTTEFGEYLDQIQSWLADMFGIQLPTAGEYIEPATATVRASRVERLLPAGDERKSAAGGEDL